MEVSRTKRTDEIGETFQNRFRMISGVSRRRKKDLICMYYILQSQGF